MSDSLEWPEVVIVRELVTERDRKRRLKGRQFIFCEDLPTLKKVSALPGKAGWVWLLGLAPLEGLWKQMGNVAAEFVGRVGYWQVLEIQSFGAATKNGNGRDRVYSRTQCAGETHRYSLSPLPAA